MTAHFSEHKEAAELFIRMLITRAYDGAIADATSILENGPPGRRPRQSLVSLHRWYHSLDNDDRECVAALVRETADAAVFGCLVLLDGLTGGYPVQGRFSDFALYLRVYTDSRGRLDDSEILSNVVDRLS
jgi:hypothetical protein